MTDVIIEENQCFVIFRCRDFGFDPVMLEIVRFFIDIDPFAQIDIETL